MKSKVMLEAIVEAIFNKKGLNVLALDVKHLTPMSDYVVLAEGTVDRHIEAIKNGIIDELRKHKEKPLYVEGDGKSGWIILDFVDVVVHLLLRDVRELYKIEQLYKDAHIVDVYEEVENG